MTLEAPSPILSASPPVEPVEPRWGMGDVGITVATWFGLQVLVGLAIALPGVISGDVQDAADVLDSGLPVFSILLVTNWVGLLAWPVIAVHLKGSGSLRRDLGLQITRKDVVPGIAGGAALFGIGVLLNLIWYSLSGSDPPDNAGMLEPVVSSVWAVLVVFVLVAIGAPIFEELFFRGFLLRAVGKRWGLRAGVLVSSTVFGLLHFQGQGLGDLWIITLLVAYGYVLAVLAIRQGGRLGASMIAHGINNGIAVVVLAISEL